MNVIIPALDDAPVAARALCTEGIPYRVVRVDGDDLAYGRLWASLWQRGESFLILEHDIVPWPGALQALWSCPMPWCGYQYPLGKVGFLGGSLGCVRVAGELTRRAPRAAELWERIDWRALDGCVESAVTSLTSQAEYHLHEPAVAHARANLTGWGGHGY